ncbi:MAG: NAD(P)-dependent oxidoreductase [Anaerolineae bacterium]
MNILVTGGFGNIGMVVVKECLQRGYTVSVFDVQNKRTEKLARKYRQRQVKVLFGDLRQADDVARAAVGQDVVLHLAAILPPVSDAHPDLCEAVNVGGTANLIAALKASPASPALVLVSSASVMGATQQRTPPVRPDDPLSPMDAYSRSKIEAEALVAASGLRYCILRLAGVLPTTLNYPSLFAMLKLFFDMPLDARCEIVIDLDVAYALVSAAENLLGSAEFAGQRGFVAGGKAHGCQMRTRDLVGAVFCPVGLRVPADALFSPDTDSYYLDWYDTEETQSILRYQRMTVEQWQAILRKSTRFVRPFIFLFRPAIMRWIERQSPFYPVPA